MNQLRKYMNNTLNFLAGTTFVAMVALTCWQVFTRYILKNPSHWSEELVSYLFGWMALIGTSVVTGERGHMNIPVLVEKLSEKPRKALLIFAEVIAFLFSAVILVYGGVIISDLALGQLTSSLGVPVGIFYFVLPLCGILNMIYTVLNMIDIVREKEA